MAESERGRYRIEALAKGLRVLSVFSEREPALRMADLVERTGLPMPTVFRVMSTLEEEGYVERLSDGLYRPDARVLTLGFAALQSLDLVQTATGPLHRLMETTGETVNLA